MSAKNFYFGVDMGGTFTKILLVDHEARIVARRKISSEGFSDKYKFVKHLKEAFGQMLDGEGLKFSQVKGLGFGVPGPVDTDRGVVLSLTNIKGWNSFSFAAYLKKYFSCPVFVDNDANCMALAEARLGAAKGVMCALCLTLGTGVGGGLILNGEIYRGPYFFGGELGHVPLNSEGPACECGGRGCLERFVGNRAILSEAKKSFGYSVTLEEVSALAKRRDARACRIWQGVGCALGMALAGIVNVLNPQVIVIGGGVSEAGPVLFQSIRQTVKRHAMKQLKNKIVIKKALLGNDAGCLGAALLVKESVEADAAN